MSLPPTNANGNDNHKYVKPSELSLDLLMPNQQAARSKNQSPIMQGNP
jgi:hypothetical protein